MICHLPNIHHTHGQAFKVGSQSELDEIVRGLLDLVVWKSRFVVRFSQDRYTSLACEVLGPLILTS